MMDNKGQRPTTLRRSAPANRSIEGVRRLYSFEDLKMSIRRTSSKSSTNKLQSLSRGSKSRKTVSMCSTNKAAHLLSTTKETSSDMQNQAWEQKRSIPSRSQRQRRKPNGMRRSEKSQISSVCDDASSLSTKSYTTSISTDSLSANMRREAPVTRGKGTLRVCRSSDDLYTSLSISRPRRSSKNDADRKSSLRRAAPADRKKSSLRACRSDLTLRRNGAERKLKSVDNLDRREKACETETIVRNTSWSSQKGTKNSSIVSLSTGSKKYMRRKSLGYDAVSSSLGPPTKRFSKGRRRSINSSCSVETAESEHSDSTPDAAEPNPIKGSKIPDEICSSSSYDDSSSSIKSDALFDAPACELDTQEKSSTLSSIMLCYRAYLIYFIIALAVVLRSTLVLNGVFIIAGQAVWSSVLSKWVFSVMDDADNVKSAREWKNAFVWIAKQFGKAAQGDKTRLAYIGYMWFLETDPTEPIPASAAQTYFRARMSVANQKAIDEMKRS